MGIGDGVAGCRSAALLQELPLRRSSPVVAGSGRRTLGWQSFSAPRSVPQAPEGLPEQTLVLIQASARCTRRYGAGIAASAVLISIYSGRRGAEVAHAATSKVSDVAVRGRFFEAG